MPYVMPGRLPVVSAYLSWGDPVTDPGVALGSMTFDVVISEEHERTAMVTDHSVERGINVVDHVRPLPDRVTLEVFVSNSPIGSSQAHLAPQTLLLDKPGQINEDGSASFLAGGSSALLQQGLQAVGQAKGFPSSITVATQQFSGDYDYVRDAYDTLTALRDGAIMLHVITPRATYTNMVLENVKMHRDAATGTSATMALELRQVRVVTSSLVDAPQPSIPAAAPSVSKGKKDGQEDADADKEGTLRHMLAGVGVHPFR